MTLLLIPVADALPAVQARLERWPDDELPSPAELAELVALTARYARASEALLAYAEAVGGRTSPEVRLNF